MKVLYILNIANKVNSFSYCSMIALKQLGIEYHIAGNWGYKSDQERHDDELKHGIYIHQIDFIRKPYHPGNYGAYKQLLELMRREKFDAIHCNTPIGGLLGRLAGRKCGTGMVIYQVHGFHFYKGAPLINWVIYYTIERWLARYTDALITINQEDYERAQKFRLRNHGKAYCVHGVGMNLDEYNCGAKDREQIRAALKLNKGDVVCIAMGDLIKRKGYDAAVKIIARSADNVHMLICGTGPEEHNLKIFAKKLGVDKRIHFLGFRTDIIQLLSASDIFLFTSLQEGLARSLMEAMAADLPCVVSEIRGNIDLIENGAGGFLVEPKDIDGFADRIRRLSSDEAMRKRMGLENRNRIKHYDINHVVEAMHSIYKQEFDKLLTEGK